MSAARLCFILGTTPLKNTLLFQRTPTTTTPFLPLRSFSSVAAAVADDTVINTDPSTTSGAVHPWPEWVAFVDTLKSRGYFPGKPATTSSVEGEGEGGSEREVVEYGEMNVLKDPCLSFARDRYDIFRSLPKSDIQVIVEGGCPKLLRKVVNSAKRLRLYVGLVEKDVCSVCSLQGSCDRAYLMLKESEADARTVDIMRLLLFYALDPLVVSGAVRPPSHQQAESSARRLLSMFIDLSETPPALAPVEPVKTTSNQKKQLVSSMDTVPSHHKKSQQQDRSDDRPRQALAAGGQMKKGDWICPECSFMNFARNARCLKCKAEGSNRDSAHDVTMKRDSKLKGVVEMKKGDWNCPQCGCMNFASRKNCFSCKEARPARTLSPGEWECPKCDFLNFRRNVSCFKCGCERTKEVVGEYEEQFWRRPQ